MQVEPRGWDDPSLYPRSEPARIGRYRRLQSWYRAVQLGASPGRWRTTDSGYLGNLLDEEQVKDQPDLNFIHPAAARHAEKRAQEVQAEHGTLEVGRLRHNLLSSMPLCFNLFGALGEEAAFIELVRAVFDPQAASIDRVVCEWAPAPADHLTDRTAFDAFVAYRRRNGSNAFVGIETKYTEPFSRALHGRVDGKAGASLTSTGVRYREVAAECGWFTRGADSATALEQPAANQLWRNVLLAASLKHTGPFGEGAVAVVSLKDDSGATKALSALTAELDDPARVSGVSLETIVEAAMAIEGLRGWAKRFRHRYLEVTAPDRHPDWRDVDGPTFGAPLTAPPP